MKKSAAAAVAAFGATLLLSASPANAACVSAEASYKRPNQTEQYVVGPKQCVVSTPWNEWLSPFVPPTGYAPVVLVEARVWITAP